MLSAYTPLGGTADIVLVTLLSIALLRGSVFGAVAGFGAGLLIDTANLGTLGFTSLLLTLAGFWIGRYGETTARDRFHAPFTSVAVVTVLYSFGALALRFVLGDPAPAGAVLSGLPATRAAQPAAHLAGLRARPPPLPAARASRPHPRGAAAWLSGDRGRPRRFLPSRPAGRGAVPADAAARAARRGARLRRARGVRRPLPAALGAAGALGRQVPRAGERQPRPRRPDRRAARLDRRPRRAACSCATCSARASRSGPPTCRRAGARAEQGAARRSAGIAGVKPGEIQAKLTRRPRTTR